MQLLKLDNSTKMFLTATTYTPDPNRPGQTVMRAFTCDLNGKPLAGGAPPIPVFRDIITGGLYAKVAENIPTLQDQVSKETAEAILALKPIFYASPDGDVKGYFIPAPDFDSTGKAAA